MNSLFPCKQQRQRFLHIAKDPLMVWTTWWYLRVTSTVKGTRKENYLPFNELYIGDCLDKT